MWRERCGPVKADCEKIGRESFDVPVVQKLPSDVAAAADEEGALTWAPATAGVRGEVGALWREGREQEIAGGRGDGGEMDGLRRNRRTPTRYGNLGKVESLGRATNPRKEPRFGCREDSQGERRHLPRT